MTTKQLSLHVRIRNVHYDLELPAGLDVCRPFYHPPGRPHRDLLNEFPEHLFPRGSHLRHAVTFEGLPLAPHQIQ